MDKKPPWPMRLTIHAILLAGGVFFLLPLVWMASTSLKPLSQTMQSPENFLSAFVATGYRATIDGREVEVVRERTIEPSAQSPYHVVAPLEEFPAGELSLPFGPDVWRGSPAFTRMELAQMNAPVAPGMNVLADEKSRFDAAAGMLTLCSGRVVKARLIRAVAPPADGGKLWLVRQWRPEDTDTKNAGSTVIDVGRAWDVLPESQVRAVLRPVPENYPTALERVEFGRSLRNTLFLCAMVVCGTVISSVVVAYGFAFLEFRGRNLLFGLTLATIMIPFAVTMIPVYLMYRQLGWVGTFKPLWVASWFGSAFFIFLLRQFFLGLPKDLLDAARIDGCGEL